MDRAVMLYHKVRPSRPGPAWPRSAQLAHSHSPASSTGRHFSKALELAFATPAVCGPTAGGRGPGRKVGPRLLARWVSTSSWSTAQYGCGAAAGRQEGYRLQTQACLPREGAAAARGAGPVGGTRSFPAHIPRKLLPRGSWGVCSSGASTVLSSPGLVPLSPARAPVSCLPVSDSTLVHT